MNSFYRHQLRMPYLSVQCCRNIVRGPNVKHVNYFNRYKQFASKIYNAISDVLFSLQTHN